MAAWVVVACGNAQSRAATVAYDSFESYTAGTQLESGTNGAGGTGLDGGTGFNSAYNVDNAYKTLVKIESQSLTYNNGSIHINGGSKALAFTANATSPVAPLINRGFTSQSASPLYFSFLFRASNPTTNDDDFVQVGFSNLSTGEPRASIGITGSNDTSPPKFFARAREGTMNESQLTSPTLIPSTTYLMVGRISKTGGSSTYNTLDLYLNPSTLTLPVSASVTATTAINSSSSSSSLSNLLIRTARLNGNETFYVDNFNIGTTYADVVPEPAALLTLTAAAGGLMLRRGRI